MCISKTQNTNGRYNDGHIIVQTRAGSVRRAAKQPPNVQCSGVENAVTEGAVTRGDKVAK